MHHERLDDLIDGYLDGSLDAPDHRELERELLSSAAARERFWSNASIHTALRRRGRQEWGKRAATEREAVPSLRSRCARAFAPLAALSRRAAVLLALAAGSAAGVAFAIVPMAVNAMRIALPLGNPGFEQKHEIPLPLEPLADLPAAGSLFGRWLADPVRLTGGEQGVAPPEGRAMLAFEKAVGGPDVRLPVACDLIQLVDLSAHEAAIGKGHATVECSASFKNAGDQPLPVNFQIHVDAFDGDPDRILAGWPESRLEAVARQTANLSCAAEPASEPWRRMTARMTLPSHARFLVVRVLVSRRDNESTEFGHHYCDDVRLVLTTHDR
ncbi:MAG: hypothetical protein WCC69_01610 [Pirellulales bacterium]